jgi:SIR2-like domain
MITAISPIHYNGILESIDAGLCIPFLGAGVNVSSSDYKGLPLAFEVALRMLRTLTDFDEQQLAGLTRSSAEDIKLRLAQMIAGRDEQELRQLPKTDIEEYLKQAGPLPSLLQASIPDLARIALHVEVELGSPYLLRRIREILLDTDCQPSPLLQTLAGLPLHLIVTTNYDRLLERAYGQRPYQVVVQPVAGFHEDELHELEYKLALPEAPIIYKIHGSFGENGAADPQDESGRLILTEEDYIEFLSVIGREDMGMPKMIRSKLAKATILFLGYSLQDWDFRTLYKALIEPIDPWLRPVSFAIQKDPPDFWVRYWQRKGVTILNVDLYEFADQVQKRWQKHLAAGNQP